MRSRWLGLAGLIGLLAVGISLVWWRGPDWNAVHDAFTAVSWPWVAAAIGLNLLSVVARSVSWDTCIEQSMEPPHPAYPLVFSAFCVGLFANAVLPGRVGEIARAAVLRRRMPGRKGATATLIGSVFAHRVFMFLPWVLFAADIPQWAYLTLGLAIALGLLLLVVAMALARRQHRELESLGPLRQVLARARQGLAIMGRPVPALKAAAFQYAGWFCQLFAVWAAMRAFQINEPLAAAGLVLVLMNVATIVPLWPGTSASCRSPRHASREHPLATPTESRSASGRRRGVVGSRRLVFPRRKACRSRRSGTWRPEPGTHSKR
jgi:uncharacterized membrane protein YbhN (UPF0104 family)